MKRILIMIDSLTCGGAEKSLISILPFLTEQNYDITLMTTVPGGLFEIYVPTGITLKTFPYKPSLLQRFKFSLALRTGRNNSRHGAEVYWQYAGKYFESLNDEFDVAIAYQQGFPTFYVAEKVKAKKKICWINVDAIAAGYSPEFCKPFYNKYDHIVTVSDKVKQQVVPFFCSDATRVTPVLDILNESLIRKMAEEKTVKYNPTKIHIVTVGRLVPPKGYDLAIEAASILKLHNIDFVWHFVGGGALYDQLRESIKAKGLNNHVILEGEQINPYPFMKMADIYVQTSKFEGFGLTIGEAKILGKPIVSTNFPVVYEQITDKKNGIVVDMSGEAIASGIERLLENVELRNSIVTNVTNEHNTTSETESAKVINLIEE